MPCVSFEYDMSLRYETVCGKFSKGMLCSCHEIILGLKENVEKMSTLLLNSKRPGVQFEDKWHELKPTVNKLLKQQAVTTQEWQNLFW